MKIDFSIKDYTIIFLHSEFSLVNQIFLCPFSCSQLLFFHSPSLELLLLALVENLGQTSWFEVMLLLTVADHLEFLVLMKMISIKVEVSSKFEGLSWNMENSLSVKSFNIRGIVETIIFRK